MDTNHALATINGFAHCVLFILQEEKSGIARMAKSTCLTLVLGATVESEKERDEHEAER